MKDTDSERVVGEKTFKESKHWLVHYYITKMLFRRTAWARNLPKTLGLLNSLQGFGWKPNDEEIF